MAEEIYDYLIEQKKKPKMKKAEKYVTASRSAYFCCWTGKMIHPDQEYRPPVMELSMLKQKKRIKEIYGEANPIMASLQLLWNSISVRLDDELGTHNCISTKLKTFVTEWADGNDFEEKRKCLSAFSI